MGLFIPDCYDIFKDKNSKKRAMQIEAIVYKRNKALENRIKVAKSAIKNNDMKTFCEVMHVDTKLFSKELESLPEEERKRALEDARQSAKEQQERLVKVQHQQWEKERNIKYGYIQDN